MALQLFLPIDPGRHHCWLQGKTLGIKSLLHPLLHISKAQKWGMAQRPTSLTWDISTCVSISHQGELVNIKGWKGNFISDSSTNWESLVFLHQWIQELISGCLIIQKSAFSMWARATPRQTVCVWVGNRPHSTKPEEWSPKGWGRARACASSMELTTEGKALADISAKVPSRQGRVEPHLLPCHIPPGEGQVVWLLLLAMSSTQNSDAIPLFHLLTEFSSFPKIMWGDLKVTAITRERESGRIPPGNRAQKNNLPLTRRIPPICASE